MISLLPNRRGALLALAAAITFGAILLGMGRTPICTCGSVKLWWGVVQSAENSQHIADWYSFSHMIRDNLSLNVLMLVWPLDAIRQWQAAA